MKDLDHAKAQPQAHGAPNFRQETGDGEVFKFSFAHKNLTGKRKIDPRIVPCGIDFGQSPGVSPCGGTGQWTVGEMDQCVANVIFL